MNQAHFASILERVSELVRGLAALWPSIITHWVPVELSVASSVAEFASELIRYT
jgi:hypothetical protein